MNNITTTNIKVFLEWLQWFKNRSKPIKKSINI